MEKVPVVTVITIVRNDAEGFLVTARSVLRQDYPCIEWIVIDGQSTDLTSAYVRKLLPQIANCKIESDTGIYDAMNKGVDLASGDWIFFMNADDIFYSENTISTYIQAITDEDDFVFSDVERREDGQLHIYRDDHEYWLGMSQDHQTVCGRASIYKKLKFDDSYRIAGDFDFLSRARVMNYTFRKIPGLVGCNKPFENGASTGFVIRQSERLRVIKACFGDMPYAETLREEYQQQCESGKINRGEFAQLIEMLEEGH